MSLWFCIVLRGPERTHNFQLTYKTNAVQEGKCVGSLSLEFWYLQVSRGGTFPCAMTLLSPSLKLLHRRDLSVAGTVFDHYLFSRGFHRHSSECQLVAGMLDVPFWHCCKLMLGKIKQPDVSWPTNPQLGCTLRTHNVSIMSALTSENCIHAFPPTPAIHLQEKSWEYNYYKTLLNRVHVVWLWKLLYSISKALSQDSSMFPSC